MKNRSVQARRKGKLSETSLEEFVSSIWAEWKLPDPVC
jgi:hypothetical protein